MVLFIFCLGWLIEKLYFLCDTLYNVLGEALHGGMRLRAFHNLELGLADTADAAFGACTKSSGNRFFHILSLDCW